jgi:hypothetical protein
MYCVEKEVSIDGKTAIVYYQLSFADQGKQTFVFRFHLQQQMELYHFCFLFAANKRKLPFSVSSIFHCISVSTKVDFWNSAEIRIFSEIVFTSVKFIAGQRIVKALMR